MDLRESVTKMTDEELAQQLKLLKQDVGPILPSTRILYEKRLLKCLLLEQAATCTITYSQQCNKEFDRDEKAVTLLANGTEKAYASVKDLHDCSYYAVQLPSEIQQPNEFHVFANKEDAIKLIKEKKGGRFKAFSKFSDAEDFSKNSMCGHALFSSFKGNFSPIELVQQTKKFIPSESSTFKSFKFQELLPLRRAIESEDLETIQSLVWSNPRYLIGSGDNPTVLHEGSRYNALHICANRNKPEACKLILATIQDPKYAQLLYPDDTEETRLSRIDFFTDLYLNTPDKHLGETPLHFACKYGNVEMVSVLIGHLSTDRQLKNIDGHTPKEVICARIKNAPSDLIRKIIGLFEDQFYVQVVGSADNSFPAKVVPPFSPSFRGSRDDFLLQKSLLGVHSHTHNTPSDLPVTLKACAGPMSDVQAQHFHNLWVSSSGTLSKDLRKYRAQIRRGDCTKGLERIGREISRKLNVEWREYWDFLDCHVNLDSADGLKKLEGYFRQQKELKDNRLRERIELERLKRQDISICQLFQQLQVSDVHHVKNVGTEEPSAAASLNSCAVPTWPPSYVKVCALVTRPKVESTNSATIDSDVQPTEGDTESDRLSVVSDGSFHTATDDTDLDYSDATEWLDDNDNSLFIFGDQPCKTDLDVFRAVENTELSRLEYPLVYHWRNNVLSYEEDVRNRWVLHDRMKHVISPVRPVSTSTPTHTGTPSFGDMTNSSQSEDSLSSDFSDHTIRVKLWN